MSLFRKTLRRDWKKCSLYQGLLKVNIKEVLAMSVDYLKKHNIDNPRLDAEVLLAHLLNKDRIQLYVSFDLPLQKIELDQYRQMIYKRAHNIPVAYLTGNKEFMSLDFNINENVLIPRPETEQLVESIIEYCENNNIIEPNIVDVGTGSGVIAVSLAYYLKKSRILGIDISKKALELAKSNIKKYEIDDRVKVVRGDILTPLIKVNKNNVDIVISNPPYIRSDEIEKLSEEVKKEPKLALNGGNDGLKYYKQIIPQSEKVLKKGGLLALEIGFDQDNEIIDIFDSNWENVEVKKDYADHKRMIFAIL